MKRKREKEKRDEKKEEEGKRGREGVRFAYVPRGRVSTCLHVSPRVSGVRHTPFPFSWLFGTAVARDIKWRRGNVAAPEAARRLKGNEKRDGVDGRMGVEREKGAKGMQREGSGNY